MEPSKVAEAAKMFVDARRTGKPFEELPVACRPVTPEESNAIVDEVTRQLGEPIAGWKISFLYKPRTAPFRAPLFASRVFSAPARIPVSLTPSRCIEPEVTFKLHKDLPARAKHYTPEEVADAVDGCPSFEIVDVRMATDKRSIRQRLNERASLIEAYADHVTNGAFVIGPPRKDWRDFDYAKMHVSMKTPDKTIVETVGGHAFIDPFLPVVVLANELRHGPGLQAGQVVATGSFCGFFPVEANQTITARFEGFGEIQATFV
jgi:2-keto-4-pentenoate hydratase